MAVASLLATIGMICASLAHLQLHWPIQRVCGGSSRQGCQTRAGEGQEMRSERARRGWLACSWWPSPQAGWPGQWSASHRQSSTEEKIRKSSSCLRRLLECSAYATSASTQGGRVGVSTSVARFSINDKYAWCGIGERRAYLKCSQSERLQAQAQSHSNASVVRWLELTTTTSDNWPALRATVT